MGTKSLLTTKRNHEKSSKLQRSTELCPCCLGASPPPKKNKKNSRSAKNDHGEKTCITNNQRSQGNELVVSTPIWKICSSDWIISPRVSGWKHHLGNDWPPPWGLASGHPPVPGVSVKHRAGGFPGRKCRKHGGGSLQKSNNILVVLSEEITIDVEKICLF